MSIKYSDSGFLDGADETKKLSFDVSGVTTGTTRTITMPDGDTKLYTGDGTSGQILTSGGTGVAPTFQTAASGGFTSSTFLDQGTLFSRDSANTLHIPDLGGMVNGTLVEVTATTKALNTAGNWDASTYATAANRAGKDFYVYLLEAGGVILSNNSTVPTGYTTTNSRKIAGFHCLCVAVGTISGHTLTGMAQGDILPRSVWDRFNRPVSSPEGMVLGSNGLWVDIYLTSTSGGNLASIYNGTILDGNSDPDYHWYNYVELFAEVDKRLPFQSEFMSFADGSNQETDQDPDWDPATTGGHSDSASRRMISNIGAEDCAGNRRQWGQDTAADDFTAGNVVADRTADTTSYDYANSIGKGMQEEAPDRVLLGGKWSSGVEAGSRRSKWNHQPMDDDGGNSARGVSASASNRL